MQAHGIGQVPYPTMSPNFVGDIVPCDPLQLASFKFEKQSKEKKHGEGGERKNKAKHSSETTEAGQHRGRRRGQGRGKGHPAIHEHLGSQQRARPSC